MAELFTNTLSLNLPDEAATVAAGDRLAQALAVSIDEGLSALVIYLQGNLGAGKTTLCRGVLRGLGHEGNVKSPTYTLVEPYTLRTGAVYHFDLYRLRDPAELEYMGVQDYFDHGRLCLVEWPDHGSGMIPAADIQLSLQTEGEGRRLVLAGVSARGGETIAAL